MERLELLNDDVNNVGKKYGSCYQCLILIFILTSIVINIIYFNLFKDRLSELSELNDIDRIGRIEDQLSNLFDYICKKYDECF